MDYRYDAILGSHTHIRVDYMIYKIFDFRTRNRDFWTEGRFPMGVNGDWQGGQCYFFNKGSNIKLPDHCSLFQMEALAIFKATQCL